MARLLRTFILALLTGLLFPCVLTAQSYKENLTLLESKLLDSKLQLANLDEQIAIYKQALAEAGSNLESSALTIAALEISLSEAQAAREKQASLALQLQDSLTILSVSFERYKKQAAANEMRVEAEIQKLARNYEKKLRTRNMILWIGAGVIVAEGAAIAVLLLK